MPTYVADIDGKGIVAFKADDDAQAERIGRSKTLRSRIADAKYRGKPLWNGTSEINIRIADKLEDGASLRAVDQIIPGTARDEYSAFVFLVPIDD